MSYALRKQQIIQDVDEESSGDELPGLAESGSDVDSVDVRPPSREAAPAVRAVLGADSEGDDDFPSLAGGWLPAGFFHAGNTHTPAAWHCNLAAVASGLAPTCSRQQLQLSSLAPACCFWAALPADHTVLPLHPPC